MPCFNPVLCSRSETDYTSTGKRLVLYGNSDGLSPFKVPCGQCIGCRLERSRQWAIRCMHEAQLHQRNSFITLTINEEQSLERRTTLIKRDFQLFMKRLRKEFPQRSHGHIGYYYCGEYGEKYGRPHYHACLFGFDFSDKQLFRVDRGNRLYTSETLDRLWGKGFCTIGDVTFESAAYVARYITKKITGPHADEHYSGRLPEYTNMSKKPAIGLEWIKKYHKDVYPLDEVILRGKKLRPARYYDKFYSEAYPDTFDKIKLNREELSHRFEISSESTQQRLTVKHEIQMLKFQQLRRGFETNSLLSMPTKDYDWQVINYFKGVNKCKL